ncbi:hypothetical protein CBM2626_A40320 [Cupriavidus taiwanensis]|uniref:PIN-like domain-containing protein n=1 Tax=Cupriavidus taiwanensis TaxID=164546 RepID=UPI000E1AFD18|nr:PIN-like domain-containing protein [Cupriavidus taiwanensis]SOZ99775.1 hypothetical protein CBM2626_A40320 [Cupriavidus taiwanensis]
MPSLFELNEPIGLWELPLSPADYELECYKALSDDETLVFLDTNVLSAAFRLHQEAREGLFKLLRIPLVSGRLVIPAWVANEYVHNAFKASKNGHGFREADLERLRTSLPATKHLSAVLHQVASDRDMEKIAKRLNVTPAEASRALNERVEQLANALNDAGGDLAIEAVHGELLTELRHAFVSNDLGEIARTLFEQGHARRTNRIPPGLTDFAKNLAADGDEAAGNADGDLAVWLEIMQLSAKQAKNRLATGIREPNTSKVLFITQEKKEDFLYRPRRRLANAQKNVKSEENTDIRLVDPRLVAEFEFKVGHRNIAFANLESVAAGALAAIPEKEFQGSVQMFVAAIRKQKRATDARPMATEAILADSIAEQASDIESSMIEPQADNGPEEDAALPPVLHATESDGALARNLQINPAVMGERRELIAATHRDAGVSQVIVNLLSESRPTENLGIRRLLVTGIPSSPDMAFALGRATYHAMQEGHPKAKQVFERADSHGSSATESGQALLAGGLFEAFFEQQNQLREDLPREGLPMLLDRVEQRNWAPAADFIHTQLAPFADRFLWIPGEPQHRLHIRVICAPRESSWEVESVTASYDGHQPVSLLKPAHSAFQTKYLGPTLNLATLRAAVSRLTLLPDGLVDVEVDGPKGTHQALVMPDGYFVDTELLSVPLDQVAA